MKTTSKLLTFLLLFSSAYSQPAINVPFSQICPGASVTVDYSSTGVNPGNVYSVEMSDMLGDFSQHQVIGSLPSTDNNGTISVSIPSAVSTGSGYRFRIVTSDPAETGPDNGSDISIYQVTASATLLQPILCWGGTASVEVTASGGVAPYAGTGIITAASGNLSYPVTDYNGCTAQSQEVLIVEPPKVLPAASAVNATCGASNGSVSVSINGGVAPYGYSWSSGGTSSSSEGLAPGYYSVVVTDANGCTATAAATVINVGSLPATPSAVSGPAAICRNATVTYSVTPVTGITGYAWALPAGLSGTSSSNAITVTSSSEYTGGFISVSAMNTCGTGNPSSINATLITTKPAQPSAISGPAYACGGNTYTYSVSPVPNAAAYEWAVNGNGASIVSGNGTNSVTVSVPVAFTTAQLSVRVVNCAGTGSARSMTIQGLSSVSGPLTGNQYPCAGTTGNYSVNPALGATSYSWMITGNASIISSDGPACSVSFAPNWTSGQLLVTANNPCGSMQRAYSIWSTPIQPGGITGPASNICVAEGVSNVSYSINPVAGANTYSWSVPTGMTMTTANNTTSINVQVAGNFSGGNVCVQAGNSCGLGTRRCLVTSSRPPLPGSISGPTTVCKSSTQVPYSVAPVTGASLYEWASNNGAVVNISGTNSNSVNFSFSTSATPMISVRAVNNCGSSAPSQRTVNVDPSCRSTNMLGLDKRLTLYPNPAKGPVTFDYYALEEADADLVVSDILGKQVFSQRIHIQRGINHSGFDTNGWRPGLYMVRIDSEKEAPVTLRLMVE